MRISFRFRWIPFIAAALAVVLGLSLGRWQLDRAGQKRALEAQLAAAESGAPLLLGPADRPANLDYRRVIVRGEFKPAWTVYLDNRPYKGRAGLYVVTPLRIAGSERHVLVARGWLPRDPRDRARIQTFATPAGPVEVQGMARRDAGQLLQLGQAEPAQPGAIMQNLDIGGFAGASGLDLHGFIVEQANAMDDGLLRDWPRPAAGVDKHLGYAFQWFALAATAFLFFIITGIKIGRKGQSREST